MYLALMSSPTPRRQTLVEAGFPPDMIDPTLRILIRRGLIVTNVDDTIRVEPPESALRDIAHRLERQASLARQAVPELTRIYYNSRRVTPSTDTRVRLLFTVEDIVSATGEIVDAAEQTVLAMQAPTERVLRSAAETVGEQDPLDLVSRSVQARVLYDTRLLQAEGVADTIAQRRSSESQRVCPDLPFSAVVVDDTWAVIDVSFPGRSVPHGLMLHTTHIVDPLRWLIERMWELSAPLAKASTGSGLDRRDQQILTLLASGASDAAIARQVKVSQRTVERRIKGILDALGASSRFQAGLLAAQRGWL